VSAAGDAGCASSMSETQGFARIGQVPPVKAAYRCLPSIHGTPCTLLCRRWGLQVANCQSLPCMLSKVSERTKSTSAENRRSRAGLQLPNLCPVHPLPGLFRQHRHISCAARAPLRTGHAGLSRPADCDKAQGPCPWKVTAITTSLWLPPLLPCLQSLFPPIPTVSWCWEKQM
jgi:hypothetical protein